ncbi:DUF2269 family protein [Usitatibacter palustris]|uniref:DUF2269 domain-containing protein n=1 Tax=Usitatibacter palustris TaxID=2732487 RepID=A0A6M4HBV9_9PROT|nr:DUF2269 domain-containing protein [Usitatibacter palustris]QJR16288.1 hypothetical protein DSM104440_03117 [Usitatibacter palustris]
MDPTAYLALKTVHILSSTVLFGTGIGTAFHFWWAYRSDRVPAIAAAARSTVIADWLFTTPAIVIQPATGLALALSIGFPLGTPWIAWSIALYLLAGACWVPVVFIQMRLRDIANASERDGTSLPPSFHFLFRAWFILGWPAFIALVAVFWLMVAKPT